MDATTWTIWAQIAVVIFLTAIRYLFEKLLSRFFKVVRMDSTSVQIFTKSLVMVVFNLIILFLFGLLAIDLVAVLNLQRGLLFLVIGLGGALLVALLSYFAIRGGYGEGYETLLAKSPTDRVLTWITFLILVGPAEDLFFLGFVQNLLLDRMGWYSIVAYVVLFTLYHYANVLSGVEKKEEFLGALPVRLLVAAILAASFYATGSLIYGFIIHSAVDSFSYAALLFGKRHLDQGRESA
jgi:membrane protease YdiL (CAAX protease family)